MPGCDSRGFWSDRRHGEFVATCYANAPAAIARTFDVEQRFVEANLPRNGRLLEVGCGTGRFLERIAAAAAAPFGVDLVPDAVAAAARNPRLSRARLTVADAARLPFPDASFDAVLCVQASIGNFGAAKRAALNEMRRVVRRGAPVLLSAYGASAMPHRLEWYRALERLGAFGRIDAARSDDLTVVTTDGWTSEGFTRAGLERLLADAGLEARVSSEDDVLLLVRGEKD